ncbi:WS/DGAT domain-containing protein [Mycobacterium sp.]|uniref:WS/DGAT domain-containing protein n=1 Tax=Mycobacterium sp. TaxID=1785 RepID=UPI002D508765|nr:WS/DGAT domain-containing protein [Mycobacterium sp.]HZA09180.1 WS/DGAT domain-containing protein [Mycobacterium sp.]
MPLYFLGCVYAMYPLGSVFHGTGLTSRRSLTGKLDIGIIACRELVSDVWRLADEFETALKGLLDVISRCFAYSDYQHDLSPGFGAAPKSKDFSPTTIRKCGHPSRRR